MFASGPYLALIDGVTARKIVKFAIIKRTSTHLRAQHSRIEFISIKKIGKKCNYFMNILRKVQVYILIK
jgi:hypothetical protein